MNRNGSIVFAGFCLLLASGLFGFSGTIDGLVVPLELSAGIMVAVAIAVLLVPGLRNQRNTSRRLE